MVFQRDPHWLNAIYIIIHFCVSNNDGDHEKERVGTSSTFISLMVSELRAATKISEEEDDENYDDYY